MPRVLVPGGSPLLVRVAAGGDAHGGGECEVRKRLGWLHGKMPHAEEV